MERHKSRHPENMNVNAKPVRLGRRSPGILYEPMDAGAKKNINVVVMHSDEDYMGFPTGVELASRGYDVLCANVMNKEGIVFPQNDKMHCVKEAIEYFRKRGNEPVVLMGHSGGGTLMSAYQALAENGPSIFSGKEMLYPYTRTDILPAADGVMFLDSNWGNAVMQLFSLDPAVVDESDGLTLDFSIDLFRPENGFRPDGSTFSDEFIRKYQQAQGARNNRLVNAALGRLERIEKGEGNYSDDEPFIIPGAAQTFFCNKLFPQDIRLMSHTRREHDLIHKDGNITTEVVHSVRKPDCADAMTHSFWEGARFLSVRTYLNGYAIRTKDDFGYDEDHVWGVEWETSYAAPPGNVAHIKAPTLVVGMTAGWEFLASETIFDMSASEDKTIAFVEGATHKFTPATHCEKYPGQFGDTMKTLHDFVDGWLSAGRF